MRVPLVDGNACLIVLPTRKPKLVGHFSIYYRDLVMYIEDSLILTERWLSFATYAKYISNLEGLLDDSPLGIYDAEFGDEDSPTHKLLEEYEYDVPSCFSPDLFLLADDDTIRTERPPFRWILIGPERSDTGMHVDPLFTNAWVTII